MSNGSESVRVPKPWLARIGTSLLGVLILAVGVAISVWMFRTRPRSQQVERPRMAPLVDVVDLLPAKSVRVVVEALGTVVAADEALMQAEVSGRIDWVNDDLVEGGVVTNGEELVRIDRRDYELSVRQRQSDVDAAAGALRIEQGRQDIAAREWALLKGGADASELDEDLALRRPQMRTAEAMLRAAEAALRMAQIELERATLRAPFDAVIAEAPADIGDQATPGALLARLVGTSTFRVKVSLRSDQLAWLAVGAASGREGSVARVVTAGGVIREGRLRSLMPELESNGRMAQVLIDVVDPLARESGGDARQLLLGDFVTVQIDGRMSEPVVRVPRTALRDGSSLWLLDGSGRLRIVKADVVWDTADEVFLGNAFDPGTRLVLSGIGAPVEGMELAVEREAAPASPSADGGSEP
jgi:RND family efflux transporter MFP subunit